MDILRELLTGFCELLKSEDLLGKIMIVLLFAAILVLPGIFAVALTLIGVYYDNKCVKERMERNG